MGIDPSTLDERYRKQISEQDRARMERLRTGIQKQQDDHPPEGSQQALFLDHEAGVSGDNEVHDAIVQAPDVGSSPAKRFSVACNFYFSDKRRRDVDGAVATVLDCLVAALVIPDDNRFVVPRQGPHEAFDCPKGEDRVEVTIEEIE